MLFAPLLLFAFTTFAALAKQNLKLALIVLCGLTPTYLVRFTIGPIPSTMLEGFLLIAIVTFVVLHRKAFATRIRSALSSRNGTTSLLLVSIGLITIASVIAVIIAPDRLSALGIWKAYYAEPLLFGVMLWTLFDREDYRKAFAALGVSALIIALFAIIQVLFNVGIPDAWATENRATSFFPYPNAVGLLLAPIAAGAIAFLSLNPLRLPLGRGRDRGLVGTSIAAILIAIGVAKTEAALVAIPAVLYVVALMSPMISQRKKMLATSGIVLATACIFMFLPSIASKLTLHDSSGLVRRAQWSETFHLLADHPYLGVGLNGYPTALAPYHDATTYEIFQYPHNVFLNIWSELGLLGLIGFLGIIIFMSRFAWQHREDPWTLACFAALLTMFIHGLVDVPFMKNDLALASVLIVVAMLSRKKNISSTHLQSS